MRVATRGSSQETTEIAVNTAFGGFLMVGWPFEKSLPPTLYFSADCHEL
jgi:hypothetical protein